MRETAVTFSVMALVIFDGFFAQLSSRDAGRYRHMRGFTRLAIAFSKKTENHAYAVSLHFMCYNFCRTHKTLRMTPAIAAGLVTSSWEVSDIVALVEKAEAEAAPKVRGPYKPRVKKDTAN